MTGTCRYCGRIAQTNFAYTVPATQHNDQAMRNPRFVFCLASDTGSEPVCPNCMSDVMRQFAAALVQEEVLA